MRYAVGETFLTCVSIGLCPTSFKIRNLLWCFKNKALQEEANTTGKTSSGNLQRTIRAPSCWTLYFGSRLSETDSHIFYLYSSLACEYIWSKRIWNRDKIGAFLAHIRIDKITAESNICLLKLKILCSLILIHSCLTNVIYPARDQDFLGSKPGLSSLYACQQKN